MKLEQTLLKLQQKITTNQDIVQINAPDYDPDIDGLQHPRRHTNTAEVSVQDHFPPSESEILDATESQAEDCTAEESLTLYTTILKSPVGMKVSPQTFKIILQHKIELPQNTVLTQKKYQN